MGDIRYRIPIYRLGGFQFSQHRIQIGKFVFMGGDILFQGFNIAAIELNQAFAPQTLEISLKSPGLMGKNGRSASPARKSTATRPSKGLSPVLLRFRQLG